MVADGSLLGHWAMVKGHTIGKTVTYQMTAEAARLKMEDAEAQRLTIKEVDRPSAPKMQLNNLDRLVNWSNEFLGRRDTDRVYPVSIIRDEQVAMGNLVADGLWRTRTARGISLPSIKAAGLISGIASNLEAVTIKTDI